MSIVQSNHPAFVALQSSCSYAVGDRTSTQYLGDKWIGNSILEELHLRLYVQSLSPNATVAAMGKWSEGGWSWES